MQSSTGADWRFRTREAAETRAAARRLAAVVEPVGLVVGLSGPLGAGKTEWTKGFAEGFGIDPRLVTSPTFVVANEYEGAEGRRLVHADFHRVESAGELESAGLRDWLVQGSVVAAEWSERFPESLPTDRLDLRFVEVAGEVRLVEAHASGPLAQRALDRWREATPC